MYFFENILRIHITILSLSFLGTYAQNDSISSRIDTVYQFGPPVIIKKKIVVQEESEPVKHPWYLGVGAGLGQILTKTQNDSITLIWAQFPIVEAEFRKGFKHLELSIAFSVFTTKTKSNLKQQYSVDRERIVTKTDTIDVYYEIVKGVSTPVYLTETHPVVEPYREYRDTIHTSTSSQTFIVVPLRCAYHLVWKAWYLNPGVGITANLPIGTQRLINSIEGSKPRATLFGSMQLALGRQIGAWRIELSCESSKSLSALTRYSDTSQQLRMMSGLKILYFF